MQETAELEPRNFRILYIEVFRALGLGLGAYGFGCRGFQAPAVGSIKLGSLALYTSSINPRPQNQSLLPDQVETLSNARGAYTETLSNARGAYTLKVAAVSEGWSLFRSFASN